jgi:transposase-like protein
MMSSVARVIPASETEVSAKATRRRFSASEKVRILREADACADQKGAVTALLRREGLYSSHLTAWRRQRDAGQFGPSARKRGPAARVPDPRDRQIAELERANRRLEARADRAERLVELQKKVSELLGIPLPDPNENGRKR